MRVTRLDIGGLRRFDQVSLAPGPTLNLITGDNGAGKTSILEAMHLMAYGRSFRGRVRDGLIREGASAVEIFVEWSSTGSTPDGPRNQIGLSRLLGADPTESSAVQFQAD